MPTRPIMPVANSTAAAGTGTGAAPAVKVNSPPAVNIAVPNSVWAVVLPLGKKALVNRCSVVSRAVDIWSGKEPPRVLPVPKLVAWVNAAGSPALSVCSVPEIVESKFCHCPSLRKYVFCWILPFLVLVHPLRELVLLAAIFEPSIVVVGVVEKLGPVTPTIVYWIGLAPPSWLMKELSMVKGETPPDVKLEIVPSLR